MVLSSYKTIGTDIDEPVSMYYRFLHSIKCCHAGSSSFFTATKFMRTATSGESKNHMGSRKGI